MSFNFDLSLERSAMPTAYPKSAPDDIDPEDDSIDELRQRALAAFLAISSRLALLSDFARALPPFDAPSLPRATAAGFRVSGTSGSTGAWPVASCTICQASWFVSRGRFGRLLAREGIH